MMGEVAGVEGVDGRDGWLGLTFGREGVFVCLYTRA